MKLRVARVHYPVTVLGPGTRLGIWVQGCSIGCHGCASMDTWDSSSEHAIDVDDLIAACRGLVDGPLDGVSITGGEPFEQPHGLAELLDHLRRWRQAATDSGAPVFDILCYSGMPLRRLRAHHAAQLSMLDAVIPEPYVAGQATTGVWRGSANQPIVALSDLGRSRYPTGIDEHLQRRLQVVVDEQDIWAVGIPGPGDLDALEHELAARGVTLGSPSWRR